MANFGKTIRRARECRRITLADVSRETKIGLHYLTALERNDFRKLPGGGLNRGYVRSYAKFDYERLPNGVPLDLKLYPTSVSGEAGLEVLISLLKTFVALGGWYLQPDVMDSDTLRDAQRHPERYPNLTVRVSGWSARFATLSKEWQDMVIQRTAHRL